VAGSCELYHLGVTSCSGLLFTAAPLCMHVGVATVSSAPSAADLLKQDVNGTGCRTTQGRATAQAVELQQQYWSLAWDTHSNTRIAVTAPDCPDVHIYDINSMQVSSIA
jgi:hypothetical protein